MWGFCDWILPRRVMVGQYPGPSPESDGPETQDAEYHLESLVKNANINLFCCLQSKVPPQNDWSVWKRAKGLVFLEGSARRDFPRPFVHYAPVAQKFLTDCRFLHAPIEDLSVPNSWQLQDLLLTLITAIEEEDRCIYIHCWGGWGRAGVVGSCLLSLLFPEEDSPAILDLVQGGYEDSRAGSEKMPIGLSRSPQTDTQRALLRAFVEERQRQAIT